MEKIMHKYETLFVLDSTTLSEEELNQLTEKFKDLISQHGEIESVDVWGKRRLAYPIKYKNEGYYVLINFTSDASFPKELDRIYGITDGVLRTLIVRKDD